MLLLAGVIPCLRGQTSVTLAWDPSARSGIAGYRLYEGGVSRTYTNAIEAGNATTATASNLLSGATYFFAVTAVGTNGLESDFSNEITYTVPLPTNSPPAPAPSPLTFAADSGSYTTPFVDNNGMLSQPVETSVTNGGRAVYNFSITNSAKYLVSAEVIAPNDGANSFYVNIDAEPTDPLMIWDIPVCATLTNEFVSWRGNGTSDPTTAQYNPAVFYLTAGPHRLIVRGREANTTLGTISIVRKRPKLSIATSTSTTGNTGTLIPATPAPVVLAIDGDPGRTYIVSYSLNLATWTGLATVTLNATGSGQFTDSAGFRRPRCFYRIQGQ